MTTLTGLEIIDAIPTIASQVENLETLEFAEVPAATSPLQARSALGKSDAALVDRGLSLRQATGMPFWDAIMTSCLAAPASPLALFHAAVFHSEAPTSVSRVSANSCAPSVIRAMIPSAQDGRALALLSSVILRGGQRAHFSLLDFHVGAHPPREGIALDALRAIDSGPGYLIESGKSYHFIGTRLLSSDGLKRFLAKALLLSPVVDRSWIAHQIMEGRCALRVSPRPGLDGFPRVIAQVDGA